MTILSPVMLLYILLVGFSLGVLAYNIVLFWCTREKIYLHFSAALLIYTFANIQWSIYLQNLPWPLSSFSQSSFQLVADTLCVVLFSNFIKQYLLLFVDFQRTHPTITRLIDGYFIFGIVIIVSYLVYPLPALLTIKNILIVISCLTPILGLPFYYHTTKHLRLFLAATLLISLSSEIFFIKVLFFEYGYAVNFFNPAITLLFAILFFVSFSLNVTSRLNHDRKQRALDLAYFASHDSLTGLFNRSEFEHRLQDVLDGSLQYTLLFIDLDQFKVINDTCGHPAGDECLRQFTQVLQEHVKQGDILARLGGDEFGMLLRSDANTDPQTRAEHIRQSMEALQFVWDRRWFRTTISIGLINVGPQTSSVAHALSFADMACYAAKEAGRNCVIVGGAQHDITLHRHSQMDMIATLNKALQHDHLILYKQVISPLQEGCGNLPHYEILVRLRLNDKLLYPGAFIPAAQRYDLLQQIDRWVIKTACKWLGKTGHLQTALLNLNLSPQTISHPEFCRFIQDTLIEYGVAPMLLCFEITEYSVINDLTRVIGHIQQLRELGISFALDDFGSGFASFDYVKRLPVDFIKIDGQFIQNMNCNANDKILVQAITDIAHNLGKHIIAESVEDQATANSLRSLGVDFGQGYHFGKPEVLLPEQRYSSTQTLYKEAQTIFVDEYLLR